MSDQTKLIHFRETRKRGLSIFRSEIFGRLGATAQDQWLLFLLPYYRFHPYSPSPLKPTNAREKAMLTPYKMYSNSSLHPFRMWRRSASALTVPTARFHFACKFSAWIADHKENVALYGLKQRAVLNARCRRTNYEQMPEAIDPEIVQGTKATNLKSNLRLGGRRRPSYESWYWPQFIPQTRPGVGV